MSAPSLDELGLKYGTDKASSGHNYLNKYEIFLGEFRNRSFTLFEIGGLNGASLRMWEEYYPNANIVCLDINPDVKRFEGDRIKVEIGNSGEPKFLQGVLKKYGAPLVVIDDGSHRWDHMRIAFRNFFAPVERGGVYIVEDIQTNYKGRFAGIDDVPFVHTLYDIADFLSCTSSFRQMMEDCYSPTVVQAGRAVDMITFLGRSCLLKKKMKSPAKSAEAENSD